MVRASGCLEGYFAGQDADVGIGLFEKNWLEEVEGVVGLEGGVAGDAGWGYGFLFFIGPY